MATGYDSYDFRSVCLSIRQINRSINQLINQINPLSIILQGEIDEEGSTGKKKKKKKNREEHRHHRDEDDEIDDGGGRPNDATPTGAARDLGTPHFEERVKTPVEPLDDREHTKSVVPDSAEKGGGGGGAGGGGSRRKRKETGSDGEWNSDEDEMSEGELERKKRLILEQLGEDDMD